MKNKNMEIEDIIIKKIKDRQLKGVETYGVTLKDQRDLTFIEWVEYLQEELLDACLYSERLKRENLPYRVYPDSQRLDLADENTCMASFKDESHAHKFGYMMWGEFYEVRYED